MQAEDQERYQNLGAVAVLSGPGWDDPDFVQFEAVLPRPDVAATYEARRWPLALLLVQKGCLEAALPYINAVDHANRYLTLEIKSTWADSTA